MTEGSRELKPGGILIPELLARGMKVKTGDTVVIVATNADGSVNGKQFTVAGILQSATGPGGRDGYIHIDDAREILRMEGQEVSEYAIRLKDFGKLHKFNEKLGDLRSLRPTAPCTRATSRSLSLRRSSNGPSGTRSSR